MKLAISLSPLQWSRPPPPRLNFESQLRLSRRFRASARDRVIDFGKYKGRMLGSLPSAYLKWVSKNLRAGDTEEWAKLADRVLDDPVYRDRLEWEAADKILSGNASTSWSGRSAVAELLEISERFGWDNEDKAGWSKIDFGLLGTSKGARIPRVNNNNNDNSVVGYDVKEEKNESGGGGGGGGGGGRRGERRERVRRLREKTSSSARAMGRESRDGDEERESSRPVAGSPFPGRDALLKKALNQQSL